MSDKNIDNTKLNKGEWAEFYVMLKLLGEGKLYTANALLQKNIDNYLNIIRIIREENATGIIDYIVDEKNNSIKIRNQKSGQQLAVVEKNLFDKYARELFDDIIKQKGPSIAAPKDVCEFAKIIFVNKPKAPSVKALEKEFGGKNDIFIEVRDPQTSIISVMGFSIKSKFAQAPTLFNAGTSSQLLYKLNPFNDTMMDTFNGFVSDNKREWAKCKEFLNLNNVNLEFVSAANEIYQDNLLLITDKMPLILSWCFKDTILGIDKDTRIKETTERMIAANPVNYGKADIFYKKKMKDFLMAGFTGMTAGKSWNGEEQVNGGYIVVMDNGEVLCYHSNDRESFRDYLYNNTFIEYVSAKKYKWSYIYKESGDYYIPINASIRFCKETR